MAGVRPETSVAPGVSSSLGGRYEGYQLHYKRLSTPLYIFPSYILELYSDRNIGPAAGPIIPKAEPWRLPYGGLTKEQQAAILHHKQSLTSGNFTVKY